MFVLFYPKSLRIVAVSASRGYLLNLDRKRKNKRVHFLWIKTADDYMNDWLLAKKQLLI